MYGVRTVSRTYSLHHGQSGRKVTVAFAALLYMLQVNYTVYDVYYGIFSRDNRFFYNFRVILFYGEKCDIYFLPSSRTSLSFRDDIQNLYF